MEQDEGSRWREDQELLDFIYLISRFPLDCLCLQSSWARNSSHRACTFSGICCSHRACTHSGTAYRGFQQRLPNAHTQGQIFRGQRKWIITSRFKVNICTWLIFGRTPTEWYSGWNLFTCSCFAVPHRKRNAPAVVFWFGWSQWFLSPFLGLFFLICTTACSHLILLGENHTLLGVECH